MHDRQRLTSTSIDPRLAPGLGSAGPTASPMCAKTISRIVSAQAKGERVFCTACGTENPPGSRFCANCARCRLPRRRAAPARTSRARSRTTGSVRTPTREFSAEAHQGAVDALTPGSALLVVKRGRTPAADSCSIRTSLRRVATRTATSSWTMSPCPAGMPSSAAKAAATPCTTSARSTAPTSTANAIDAAAAVRRRRGADRQVPAGLPDRCGPHRRRGEA